MLKLSAGLVAGLNQYNNIILAMATRIKPSF